MSLLARTASPAAPAAPRPLLIWEAPRLGLAHHAGLERDWKQLHRAVPGANPFLSWEWQAGWASHQPDGAHPLIVAEMFPDGSPSGLLALQRVRRRWPLVQLEFLGQGSGGDELDCLLHPQAPPETAMRLLAAALGRARASLLRLDSAVPDGACAHALAALHPLPVCAGTAGRPAPGAESLPSLPLPFSFDALLEAHSANFRAEVRRRRRALARALPETRVEAAQSPAAVAAALEHLFRLHNLRRAQKDGEGIFESEAMRAFHRAAATRLAARGHARIYLLRTRAEVLAALYGFEAGRRFLYFQSGFDPAHAHLSPGTVLLSAVIEDCIARRLSRFEFLRGDERYKGRWTTEARRTVRLECALGPAGAAFLRARNLRRRLVRTP